MLSAVFFSLALFFILLHLVSLVFLSFFAFFIPFIFLPFSVCCAPPPPFSVARPAAILRREIYSDMARKDAESSANRRLLRPCIARRSRYRYDK